MTENEIIDSIQAILDLDTLKRIIKVINQQWDITVRMASVHFKRGDRVSWTHRGNCHRGTVTKVNPKSIKVTEDTTGCKWNCGPTCLNRLEA